MDRLAEIEQRLAAATPGPWDWHLMRGGILCAHVSSADGSFQTGCLMSNIEANAAFIAAAPADIRYLLDEVKRLRGGVGNATHNGNVTMAKLIESEIQVSQLTARLDEALAILSNVQAMRDQMRAERDGLREAVKYTYHRISHGDYPYIAKYLLESMRQAGGENG